MLFFYLCNPIEQIACRIVSKLVVVVFNFGLLHQTEAFLNGHICSALPRLANIYVKGVRFLNTCMVSVNICCFACTYLPIFMNSPHSLLKGTVSRDFLYSVFPPKQLLLVPLEMSWGSFFFASWLSCKHFKMTPRCPMHWGVETPRCPMYRGVKTPHCPM